MVRWMFSASALTLDTSDMVLTVGSAFRTIENTNSGVSGLRTSFALSMRTALFRSLMISSNRRAYASFPSLSSPITSVSMDTPHRNPELSSAPPTAPMYWESGGTMGASPSISPMAVTRPEIREVPPTCMIGCLTSISWSCCS